MFRLNFNLKSLTLGALAFGMSLSLLAQESPKEEDFFKILKVPAPEGTLLEVGGLAMMPNGNLAVSTRRGDVFIVENPTSQRPYFNKFASGLHEILGLAYHEGSLYMVQRGELTKLTDLNSDGKADWYETVASWPLSAHYHEYSFGPKIASDGNFIVTTNVAFGDQEWWRGESKVPFRGWTLKIHPDGTIEPYATGMRSPAGPGILHGEVFYTENQGDYMGSGGLWHLEKGDFSGHPAGLRWSDLENSPIKMTPSEFDAVVDPMKIKGANGNFIKPENDVNAPFITLAEAEKSLPAIKLPAVWLPHGIHGISNSEPIMIPENYWGPFGGQILVGDQGQSKIMRIMLEKVNGVYQGASIDFRAGFQSGVLRMVFAEDQSLFVGETNRGWGSAGDANEGLQRLVWNREAPFEMRTVKAKPDGFEIEFTKPVDKKSAEDLTSYMVSSFTYKYFPVYGSPPVKAMDHEILGVEVSEDGRKVRIAINDPQQYHIHKISLPGIREAVNSHELVHMDAYYTLNQIPSGDKMVIKPKPAPVAPAPAKATAATSKPAATSPAKPVANAVPSEAEIKTLLAKNTCTACHQTDKKVVGPPFAEIAKRNYTPEKIVDLIYNPKPENWPGYATPMAPMPQVLREEALKIARWINSLK
ncbi:c-type cytochrome [Algoriphagus aestuariicola]|uniref:C-type cytochrome n=1 Tax=Algoriphagus aestuariicola TaxID=1852016 RepID=A0ABS3BMI0_9BACT|nr:c-type cytochrome [Algoriphagus aestuariicola]MBN7800044.1 c-type cytochrome [Algoriphagus aestuariicola]